MKKSVVIIKGNPLYTDTKEASLFYDDLENFLIGLGFDVYTDDGEISSEPPEADIWIGHSRGIDKLSYAPDGTITVKMGFPSDSEAISHPMDDARPGKPPNEYHFVLSDSMKKELTYQIYNSLLDKKS